MITVIAVVFRLCFELQGYILTWRKARIRLKVSVRTIVTVWLEQKRHFRVQLQRNIQIYSDVFGQTVCSHPEPAMVHFCVSLQVTHRHPVEFVVNGNDKEYCLKLGPCCVCVVLVQVLLSGNIFIFFFKKTSQKNPLTDCQIFLMTSVPALTNNHSWSSTGIL